jgi:hypothetical protein
MRFTWEGFARLVPSLVKAGVRGSGAVDLSLKVAKAIAADYDGALTLVFDDAPAAPVSFLYKAAADGLRLTSLARDSVTDLHVTHASPTPIVIFFGVSP